MFPTWTDGTLAMYNNWGTISYVVVILPVLYVLKINIRTGVVVGAILTAFGAGLRCIPFFLSKDSTVRLLDLI